MYTYCSTPYCVNSCVDPIIQAGYCVVPEDVYRSGCRDEHSCMIDLVIIAAKCLRFYTNTIN